jgi:hypothetical protein
MAPLKHHCNTPVTPLQHHQVWRLLVLDEGHKVRVNFCSFWDLFLILYSEQ